jgi:hypothetical protein
LPGTIIKVVKNPRERAVGILFSTTHKGSQAYLKNETKPMIELQPINETFVADITGLNVRHISDADFDDIYAAWLQFGVLRLRNQPIDEDDLEVFSARFGPLEEIPMGPKSGIAMSFNYRTSLLMVNLLAGSAMLKPTGIRI